MSLLIRPLHRAADRPHVPGDAAFPDVPPRCSRLHPISADLQLVAGPFAQLLSLPLVCVRTQCRPLAQIASPGQVPCPTLGLRSLFAAQQPVLSLGPTGLRSPSKRTAGLVVSVCHPTLSPGGCHLPSLHTRTLDGFSAVQSPRQNAWALCSLCLVHSPPEVYWGHRSLLSAFTRCPSLPCLPVSSACCAGVAGLWTRNGVDGK